jgi:hypothetical protein
MRPPAASIHKEDPTELALLFHPHWCWCLSCMTTQRSVCETPWPQTASDMTHGLSLEHTCVCILTKFGARLAQSLSRRVDRDPNDGRVGAFRPASLN